jgi:hypothetical protein
VTFPIRLRRIRRVPSRCGDFRNGRRNSGGHEERPEYARYAADGIPAAVRGPFRIAVYPRNAFRGFWAAAG